MADPVTFGAPKREAKPCWPHHSIDLSPREGIVFGAQNCVWEISADDEKCGLGFHAQAPETAKEIGLSDPKVASDASQLADLRNRVYATHLRSFLSADPLGSVDSYGLFNYVAGDPINLRDPWGLDATSSTADNPAPDEAEPNGGMAVSLGGDEGEDITATSRTAIVVVNTDGKKTPSFTAREPKYPPVATTTVSEGGGGGGGPSILGANTPGSGGDPLGYNPPSYGPLLNPIDFVPVVGALSGAVDSETDANQARARGDRTAAAQHQLLSYSSSVIAVAEGALLATGLGAALAVGGGGALMMTRRALARSIKEAARERTGRRGLGAVNAATRTGVKGLLKNAGLPHKGKIRFVPEPNALNTGLRQAPGGGFVDRFGNIWKSPKGQIIGEPHWDVQLSKTGRAQLGRFSPSGGHLNVSRNGRVLH